MPVNIRDMIDTAQLRQALDRWDADDFDLDDPGSLFDIVDALADAARTTLEGEKVRYCTFHSVITVEHGPYDDCEVVERLLIPISESSTV